MHVQAVEWIESRDRKLVTDHVLVELISLAHARGYSRQPAIVYLNTLLVDPRVTVIWNDRKLFDRGIALLDKRQDKGYSLCDAFSFVLMRDHNVTEALTLDRHFEQEGFRRLLTDQ